MQIIIDLYQSDEGVHHFGEHQLPRWNSFKLAQLLIRLKEDGYHINSLYGRLVYDRANDKVIDAGEAGKDFPTDDMFFISSAIYKGEGKLFIIFTDKKYALFTDKYFVAMYFCHLRRVRPLSPYQALSNYENLIYDKDEELLGQLYEDAFKHTYKDSEGVPTLFNLDGTIQPRASEGYAIWQPFPKELEDFKLKLN